jgi:hypothetical protein
MLLKYCGQGSFVALPPRTNHVIAIIPLAKEEICCFKGHPSTPSDHKIQDNFAVFIFQEEKCHIAQKTW